MTQIYEPKVTVNKLSAVLPAALEEQKILIVGQKLSSGSATEGIVLTNILESQINSLVGEKSMLAEQLRQTIQILKESGSAKVPRIDILPFEDAGASTQAQGKITITEKGGSTGLASTVGTITAIIGSEQQYSVSYTWAEGDSIASIRTGLNTAIGATSCPVTATVNVNDIEIDFNNAGTVGNAVGLGISGTTNDGTDEVIGNVAFALTGFTGGAGDPSSSDVTTALNLIVERYQTICAPSQWAVASIKSWLNSRFNVDNDILDGICITHKIETVANLKSYATTLNSQSIVVFGDEAQSGSKYIGALYREFDFCQICHIGAIIALRMTTDSNLSRYVVNGQTLDLIGGISSASLPFHNTPLYNINVADSSKGFSKSECIELNDAGISLIGNNVSNSLVLIGQMVTTYKTNAIGQNDPTWHYFNVVKTVSACAEYFFRSFKQDYAQTRLTTGNLIAFRGFVNEDSFKSSLKKYYLDLSDEALVPNSDDAVKYFIDSVLIALNLVDGEIIGSANCPIVVQLRKIIFNLITSFSVN